MGSFALHSWFVGIDPRHFKIVNIAIHVVNGCLVLWLLALVNRAVPSAQDGRFPTVALFAITAAWCLLPVNLTSVLYVVQRMESLSATFMLIGLSLYALARLRMIETGRGLPLAWAALVSFTALAALTKESGILLPLYAFVMEVVLFRFRGHGPQWSRGIAWLFAATLAAPLIAGLIVKVPELFLGKRPWPRPYTPAERWMTEARALIDYMRWTLAPGLSELSLYHDDYRISRGLLSPPGTLAALLGLAALAASAIVAARSRPFYALGILWFFCGHSLTVAVYDLELVHEHRNYLPSLGLLVAAASLLPRRVSGARMRYFLWASITAYLVMLLAVTAARAAQWSNPLIHAEIEAREHPQSPRATFVLGRTLSVLAMSGHEEFADRAAEALERAAAIPGSAILAEQVLLAMSNALDRPIEERWWQSIRNKLQDGPLAAADVNAVMILTRCQVSGECRFDPQKLLNVYFTVLDKSKTRPMLLVSYADFAFAVLGDRQLAIRALEDAVEISPHVEYYRSGLIRLLIAEREYQRAEHHIRMWKENRPFWVSLSRIAPLEKHLAELTVGEGGGDE